jgi:hypothetical protein
MSGFFSMRKLRIVGLAQRKINFAIRLLGSINYLLRASEPMRLILRRGSSRLQIILAKQAEYNTTGRNYKMLISAEAPSS